MNQKLISVILLFLAVTTIEIHAQINGTKTIGVTPSNYETFTDAVDSLILYGVDGTVTFNVISGTYTEQISIPEITGASASNTITFQSESGDSTDVTLNYAPSSAPSNYTLNLNGADYVIFKNMTISSTGSSYARVVALYNSASNNKFLNCQFIGISTSSADEALSLIHSYGNQDDNNSFESNYFKDGSYGLYYIGADPGDETGTIIRKNYFSNQYTSAIYTRYQDAPAIDSNYIESNTSKTDIQCIYAWDCDNNLSIQKNTISLPASSGGYGIYLYSSDGIALSKGLVANNFIQLNSSGNSSRGIYMRFCDYQQFYYNTINLTGNLSSSCCIYLSTGNAYTSIANNILYNEANGYALYASETSAISSSDYNDLKTTGSNLCYYNGNITDLSDWQSSTPHGDNSLTVDPYFFSELDLHANNTSLQSGTFLSAVITDIDNESRDGSTPCMGADEFIYPALGGTYTIGSGGSDYTSFTEAVQALTDGGVRAAVYFDIENGTYTEQIIIPEISNTSSTNTITFQSAGGDSSLVTLTYSPGSGANYTLQLNDAHFIDFKEITLSSGGTDYSGVIEIIGGSSDLNFQNMQIIGGESAGLTDGILVKGDVVAVANNIEFNSNLIKFGTYGMKIAGDNSTRISITQNHFIDQSYWSVNLITIKAPDVSRNYFDYSKSSVFYGVYFHICDSALKLSNNYFVAPNSSEGFGLWHKLSDGDTEDYGLISNNYMQINCSGTYAYAIYCDESTYQKFYQNSINITGNLQSTRVFSIISGCSDISIKNNILTNQANGYSIYSEVSSGVTSNYNNLYTTGTNLGFWNAANQSDLSAWQAISSQDANSLSVDPQFSAADDPHFPNPLLNDAGTPVTEVTDDIDGEVRDATNPDIGADEFCLPPVATDETACETRTIPNLSATGSNIKWYSDGDLTNLLFSGNPFSTGETAVGIYTYYVTQTINESESQSDTVTLTIKSTPGAPVSADQTICYGETTPDLTATGSNIQWYDDAGLTNLVHTGSPFPTGHTNAGEYIYYVTQTENGCESDANTVTLTIHSIPSAPVSAGDTICFGEPTPELSATGSNIQWYEDETLITLLHSGSTYTPDVTDPGTYVYYVTQTVNNCESPATNDTLIIHPIPAEPVAPDKSICYGETTPDLTATGNNIQWYDNAGLGIPIHTGSSYSTGKTEVGSYDYWVTQTENDCESLANQVTLTINGLPDAVVMENDTICASEIHVYNIGSTATGGHSYSWSSDPAGFNSTEANPSVTPTQTTTYTLVETIDATGCQNSNSVTITIYPNPDVTVLDNQTICESEIREFQIGSSGVSGHSYTWTSNPSGFTSSIANPAVTPTQTTTYILTETIDSTGCQSTDSVTITINPNPDAAVIADQTICYSEIQAFDIGSTAITGNSYSWSSDPAGFSSSEANPSVTPTQTTTYTLVETIDATNCQTTNSVLITINTNPVISVTAEDNPIVFNGNTLLTASGANTYEWEPETGLSSTTGYQVTANPDTNTIYFVTGTDLNGCTGTDSIYLAVYCHDCPTDSLFTALLGSFNHGCTNNNYNNNANCSWKIQPPGISKIYLRFALDSFDIIPGDIIRIYDGQNNSGTLLGEFDNDNPPADTLEAGTSMFVEFISNDTLTGLGFQAYWSNEPFTGIYKNQFIHDLIIYPNPTDGIITIEFNSPETESAQIILLNTLGQKIIQRTIYPVKGKVKEIFNVSRYPNGYYFLRIDSRKEWIIRKVVLQK